MPYNSEFFYHCHFLARLIFGLGFFAAAIFSQQALLAVVQCVVGCIILRWLQGDWKTVTQAWRMLRWLMIPIILLHLLFTPGTMLFAGSPVMLSSEGLRQGIWLSLHLAAIFLSALIVARMWLREEWLHHICAMSIPGNRLHAHLMLLYPLQRNVLALIRAHQMRWRLHGSMSTLGPVAMALLRATIASGKAQARALWLRWHDDIHEAPSRSVTAPAAPVSMLGSSCCALFGGAWFLSIWLL